MTLQFNMQKRRLVSWNKLRHYIVPLKNYLNYFNVWVCLMQICLLLFLLVYTYLTRSHWNCKYFYTLPHQLLRRLQGRCLPLDMNSLGLFSETQSGHCQSLLVLVCLVTPWHHSYTASMWRPHHQDRIGKRVGLHLEDEYCNEDSVMEILYCWWHNFVKINYTS